MNDDSRRDELRILSKTTRRGFLRGLGAAGLALPFCDLLRPRPARAQTTAKRVIFFYFPDGVAMPTTNQSLENDWHPQGSGSSFTLSKQLEPLAPYQQDCVFLQGLHMGSFGENNHGEGAKKILTGTDGGNGQSLDQYLAATFGASSPWHHVYLSAMAKLGPDTPKSSDAYISYPTAGQSIVPEDNPLVAFQSLFGNGAPGPGMTEPDPVEVSVIDGALEEMKALQTQLGGVEKAKLDLHLEALREAEKRIKQLGMETPSASCESPVAPSLDANKLYDPAQFPKVLEAQIDLMVLAMACGITKVGTIQASYHTSELKMGAFPGTEMFSADKPKASHEVSHYGTPGTEAFNTYIAQRRWWASQFAYLLEQLKSRPDEDGTMLDTSLILFCSEVSDGNTHSHHEMPFFLAGRANGLLSTGRLLSYPNTHHSNLLSSIAHAAGQPVCFGQDCNGPLNALLT